MKIAHSWLQTLIHIPESPQEIARKLTGLGLEVESLEMAERIKGNLEGMVIGEVLTCEKHPDADKLSLTTVDAGGTETLSIVCGAPNVAKGQKVIVATVGATLYPTEGEPFTIKKSKIRGQLSEGMICAEDEIGLGKSHEGIMVLDTPLPNGTPAIQYFNLGPEYVYEIGLTPNRIDAASHYGVARDVAALFQRPLKFPKIETFHPPSLDNQVIEIEKTSSCRRYSILQLDGLKVKPSPEWMQNLLKSIGLNPINNLVDATNFVLHELGQPLHAFDAEQIKGQKIIVRKATIGEKIRLLDKTERELNANDLIIANANEPMALAGIMGGAGHSVTENTTSIWVESAWFDPGIVRKSSQYHSIKTDSSFRFERGTDPEMVIKALLRYAYLLKETCPEIRIKGLMESYPQPFEKKSFNVKWNNINRLIGIEIPREIVTSILHGLEIKTTPIDLYGHAGFEEEMVVEVPAYRVDVNREADIVEEILRVYGLDNIPMDNFLRADFISSRESLLPEKTRQRASQLLADIGWSEIITNSLVNPHRTKDLPEFPPDNYVHILNRLSEDLGAMRQTLLFSGLDIIAHNINRKQTNLRLFEFGKVYCKTGEKLKEGYRLGLFQTGLLNEKSWESGEINATIFHLQQSVMNLFQRLGFGPIVWKEDISTCFSYGRSLWMKNQKVGEIGMLHPGLVRQAEIKQGVFFADIDWDKCLKLGVQKVEIKEVIKFPEVRRDLSVVLDRTLNFEKIEHLVRQTAKNLVRRISVFDVYEGDKIEAGKKAYALSIVLQDENQTLTDEAIDKTMNQIMNRLEREVGAFIRK